MSKITLDDALACAERARDEVTKPEFGMATFYHSRNFYELVLLADEVARLRVEVTNAYAKGYDDGYAAGYN